MIKFTTRAGGLDVPVAPVPPAAVVPVATPPVLLAQDNEAAVELVDCELSPPAKSYPPPELSPVLPLALSLE
tara:strand:+ start:627 stop:842 length:216 start_codon:yes stop_codon:yes gene_type:complete